MGSASTKGYWRVPPRVNACAIWGHAHVDLRGGTIETPVVDVNAKALMGGVTITVPAGARVEMRGSVLMGGARNAVRRDRADEGAVLVRVRASGLWGGVVVRPAARPGGSQRHRDGGHGRRDSPGDQARQVARDAIDTAMDALVDTVQTRARRPRRGSPSPNGQNPSSGSSRPPRSQIPPGTLTMLVSDIAGSTRMAERLGDQRWVAVLQAHNAIVRGRVAERGGTEVKAQGDGFLFVFSSARSAVLSAIDIQRALADYRDGNPDTAVEVRVGLHTGEVVATDDDVFGQNVVVASRIADVAAAGEIVVSGVTRDLTASASDLGFDAGVEVELKGISQPCRVHQVEWDGVAG
jgi:class 3 adenylate cyclase